MRGSFTAVKDRNAAEQKKLPAGMDGSFGIRVSETAETAERTAARMPLGVFIPSFGHRNGF